MTAAEPVALARLLDLPVRHRGITLGRVTDVLLDGAGTPIGLAVLSVADEEAFLPWPSAEPAEGEVLVPYPLTLLSEAELGFYRLSSRSLREALTSGDAAIA